ncbi:septal ring lytic transglycosylase RlpA family protein [Balneola sp. MJW-20]|uniref:septal ring lytic transglycosylase RlpA family protein n=1 Tax=Gracilimonas aurantiaca TaxID=3234185 RepID=UPI003467DB83
MRSIQTLIIVISFSFYLVSCGTTRRGATPSSEKRNVSTADAREIESGVASWYGPQFNGKLTANGEIYDMDGFTAAHRTLPFNTILLVENLDNGNTVQVRVNDRGPFAKDRIIDLSRGAAKKMEMIGPGTARVRLYLLEGDLENSRVTDLKVMNFTVQLGSFQNRDDAERRSREISGSRVEEIRLNGKRYYRVYYGSYTDRDLATEQKRRLQSRGFTGFVKQIEND